MLVIGGLERRGVFNEGNRGTIKATCEIIDIRSRSIVPAPSLNVPHAQCVALQTLDSNVVVIGGLTTF